MEWVCKAILEPVSSGPGLFALLTGPPRRPIVEMNAIHTFFFGLGMIKYLESTKLLINNPITNISTKFIDNGFFLQFFLKFLKSN